MSKFSVHLRPELGRHFLKLVREDTDLRINVDGAAKILSARTDSSDADDGRAAEVVRAIPFSIYGQHIVGQMDDHKNIFGTAVSTAIEEWLTDFWAL